MSNRRNKTYKSISNLSMLNRQRKAIGEFGRTRANAPRLVNKPRGSVTSSSKKSDGFKVRSYADVKRVGRRKETIKKTEAITPYPTNAHYAVATGGLSAFAISIRSPRKGDSGKTKSMKKDNKDTFLAEMGVYRSTSDANMAKGHEGQVAILHSFQNENDKQDTLASHGITENEKQGNIYEPNIYGNGEGHDMRANSAWLLGLAHHKRNVVMSVPLSDVNLVRKSAPNHEKSTDRHLSALGREVLGMVQHGHFEAASIDAKGKQVLTPMPSAARAKLRDFQTPKGIAKPELKRKLVSKKLDVSRISD